MKLLDRKIKHFELIENVIERMEKNSFMLKSWTMTLVVAICALSSQDSNAKFIIVAFLPIILFWVLDSYYLLQERKFRTLYSMVIDLKEDEIDFNLDVSNDKLGKKNISIFKCLFSFTEIFFYIPIFVAVFILIFIFKIF